MVGHSNKTLFLILLIGSIIVLITGFTLLFRQDKEPINDEDTNVMNFEECVAVGNPVMESYPPQCRTDDGRTFTQYIGNELELSDQIVVSNPRPNQVVESPIEVEGKAVGSWLFEANTDYVLYDANDNVVAEGLITADGDWMTSDFVPFSGTVEFTEPGTDTGRLVINKSNPSGLEENAGQLIIPVKFSED